jgi:hypothetical protein
MVLLPRLRQPGKLCDPWGRSPLCSCSVEITGAIENEAPGCHRSVSPTRKAVQNLLGPTATHHRTQLEDRPKATSAALQCRAIQVAGAIQD